MMDFRRALKFLKDIILFSDSRIGVLSCIVSYYLWGIILLLPGTVLERPYYRGLQALSNNEHLWATIFIVLASFQLYRLLRVRELKDRIYLDYGVRIISCIFSTYIFLSAISQTQTPPVAADTLIVVLLAWWDFFRYKGKVSEDYYVLTRKSRER